jgi:hypothetical protein
MKWLAAGVALPAWLTIGWHILGYDVAPTILNTAIFAFVVVGLLELGFVASAFWRMDL